MTNAGTAPTAAAFDRPVSIAVLPARGGSKRVPRKNIREISGKPLISWAIETALASGVFEEVIVSTDDPEIASVARESGAAVPFSRPPELSDDFASTTVVMQHAVEYLARSSGHEGELVCCIYPAAIFVDASDYTHSQIQALQLNDASYLATVTKFAHPVQRALTMSASGQIAFIDPAASDVRTQDLPTRWHDAGQFYWARTKSWIEGLPILENSFGYELDSWKVQDIDTEEDWRRAELLHSLKINRYQR